MQFLKNKVKPIPKFGAFNGVFVPTFLSIIGVILFLRLGYIVGSIGIFQTIVIIILSMSVAFSTGLSLSSIISNIKIDSGGAYSIISKTLGLEVGGSVGIPLYLAQLFSVTLYLFGFSEVWSLIFPHHNRLLVLILAFLILFILTFISTKIAIKAQAIIFIILLLTLFVMFISGTWIPQFNNFTLNNFSQVSFWGLFALFFPAVTGIMAGIGLSGELKEPKNEIPKGIIVALILTFIIYILTTIWLGASASSQELINNSTIIISLAIFAPLVILGIFLSAFSSALTNFVAAPRLLQSMAEKSLFPGSKKLSQKNSKGIPKYSIFFSSIFIVIILLLGNLNIIAPFITMFFLVTYAIINIVVFIEQSMGLVSFRPTIKISKIVPLYGAISSIVFMILISPIMGLIALLFIFMSYLYLVNRRLKSKQGDIRSGLFRSFSEWASKKVLTLPESTKHTWKPSVLVPVLSQNSLLGNFPLIKSITFPNGTMTVLGLDINTAKDSPETLKTSRKKRKENLKGLFTLVKKFGQEGIFTSSSTVSAYNYVDAITISLEAIESQTFPPNILFLPFKPKMIPLNSLKKIMNVAKQYKVGVTIVDKDEDIGLGSEEDINVWIPGKNIHRNLFEKRDYDLSLLLAYKIFKNWAGTLNLWICVPKDKETIAKNYLKKLVYEARLPSSTNIIVSTNSFNKTLSSAPKGDIHFIPITKISDISKIRKISQQEKKSFFFVLDSGKEDILA